MGVGAIIVSTRIFISMHIISAMPMSEENAKADKSYQGVHCSATFRMPCATKIMKHFVQFARAKNALNSFSAQEKKEMTSSLFRKQKMERIIKQKRYLRCEEKRANQNPN